MGKERFKLVPAVHLFLVKDGKILLSRRFNTGYQDGNYSVPAGHMDGGEHARDAMVREAEEETGIIVNPDDLDLVHVMHRFSAEERVDLFFTLRKWSGEIKNTEPRKCDELRWISLDQLPKNMVAYVRHAMECYVKNIVYSEFSDPAAT